MAEMLAGSIAHLGVGQLSVKNAMISAAFIWVGFVLTVLVTTHGYQGNKRSLTLIDGALTTYTSAAPAARHHK